MSDNTFQLLAAKCAAVAKDKTFTLHNVVETSIDVADLMSSHIVNKDEYANTTYDKHQLVEYATECYKYIHEANHVYTSTTMLASIVYIMLLSANLSEFKRNCFMHKHSLNNVYEIKLVGKLIVVNKHLSI